MTYFFIHTPKTSGTTFVDVLQKDSNNHIGYFYPSSGEVYDFESTIKQRPHDHLRNNPDWAKYNIIAGHFTFGVHDIFKNDSFMYLATVREPVSHYISLYKALMRLSPSYVDYMLPENRDKSILAMLDKELTHNIQTFFLSGLSQAEIRKDKQRAYETVVENIEKYFAGIYLTENFDEGLFYMKHKASIKPLFYEKKNVATNHVNTEILKNATNHILEVNDIDTKIYQYVKKRFNEEFNAIPGVKTEVLKFKLANYLHGTPMSKILRLNNN